MKKCESNLTQQVTKSQKGPQVRLIPGSETISLDLNVKGLSTQNTTEPCTEVSQATDREDSTYFYQNRGSKEAYKADAVKAIK